MSQSYLQSVASEQHQIRGRARLMLNSQQLRPGVAIVTYNIIVLQVVVTDLVCPSVLEGFLSLLYVVATDPHFAQ